MINASGIIKQILSGNMTVHELMRDVATMEQFSSGTTNYNFVVNVLLAMGVRIVLNGNKVIVAPVDQKADTVLPAFMRVRKHPTLQHIRNEPFVFLPELDNVYGRMEIMFHGNDPQPMTGSAYHEVLSLQTILSTKWHKVPQLMVAVPVLCVTDNTIRLVRVSLFNLATKVDRKVIESGCCIIKGKASRRTIVTPNVAVEANVDVTAALANAVEGLAQLHDEYTQPNVFTMAEAQTLRNILDTRKRDPRAIQMLMRRVTPAEGATDA